MILRGDDHRRSTRQIPRDNPGSAESNNNKSGEKEKVKDETSQTVTIDAVEGFITCTVLERVRALAGNSGSANCCLSKDAPSLHLLGPASPVPKTRYTDQNENQNENLQSMVHVCPHNANPL